MKKNPSDYIILALLGAIYVGVILRFQTTPSINLISTAGFALLYFLWGLFHEARSNNFYLRVVLEYLLVAILGVAIISTLLL